MIQAVSKERAAPGFLLPRCYHLLRPEPVSPGLVLGFVRVGTGTWAF